MKRMLLAVFSALCFGASAQITVTAATFPSAGDTLRFAFDSDVNNIALSQMITPPGGNQLWDLTGLQAEQKTEVAYQPAANGMSFGDFPGADLAIIGTNGETYFNKTATVFELLGYAGDDPANFGVDVVAKFNPAFIERRAPLNFFDVYQQTTNLSLPFSTAGLPDTLFSGAPFVPDSIRVRINSQRLEVVDAWGSCQIPGGDYPVLRMKRTEYTTTALDVLVPFLGWVDLSNLIPGGGGFGNFLGTDTTLTYRFYSGTEKEEIAVLTTDASISEVVSVRFKDNGIPLSAEDADAPGKASIAAFPNPAVEWVRFDCTNLPASEYTLKIFNIVGKVVWQENHFLSGNKSIRVELEHFKKGTYLYNLTDRDGTVIGTKRLVVVKP